MATPLAWARSATCQFTEPARAMPIFERAAGRTHVVVPLLRLLLVHAAEMATLVQQRAVAGGTAQDRRRRRRSGRRTPHEHLRVRDPLAARADRGRLDWFGRRRDRRHD